MKRFALSLALAVLLTTGGCSGLGFRDLVVFQDMAIANRNQNEAYKAWKRARPEYWQQGVPHYLREHIGRGFQQGFIDAAAGGSQEVPNFPPRTYWGPGYQTPRGNEMIAAWFRGYSDGAMAGEQSGLARYVTLPTSSSAPSPADLARQKADTDTDVDVPREPFEFLPPDFLNDPIDVPVVPPPAIVPPRVTEPLQLPPGTAVPVVPKVIVPPVVPGKQTILVPGAPKPAVVSATPLVETGAVPTTTAAELR